MPGIACLLNKYSTTVVFERPPENLVKRWQLACTGKIAHVVVMPSHTQEKLTEFVESLLPALCPAGGSRPAKDIYDLMERS